MISRTPIDGYRKVIVYDREREVTVYAPPEWSVWRVGVEWNGMVFETDTNCWGKAWRRRA